MTSLEARQIVLSQRRFKQARAEYKAQQLRETRYRGVPTIIDNTSPASHVPSKCCYRGCAYIK